ncbi:MAG: replication/maintenance protein RepL [Clostridium sp.]|uniref:replication/maintenance protein RepL n=1 Tax=Clostridium sp. TaxID=1506 RepID=UPI003EE59824
MKSRKIIKEVIETRVDSNGNVDEFVKQVEQYIPRDEPDFVKLYLDHILVHKAVSLKISPILSEICKLATYADNETGGMMIFLNKFTKELIKENLGYKSIKMVEKAIDSLYKGNLILRKGRGAYILNPYYFGKGAWADIKAIRATLDFNEKTNTFTPHLEFNVYDNNGNLLENYIRNENNEIVDTKTGEVIKIDEATGEILKEHNIRLIK